jgi:AraC-like DNA-binding protein
MSAAATTVTEPLARSTVVQSGDVDELTAVGTDLFSPHQLRYRGSRARLSATPVAAAHLICMQYGSDAAVETTESLDYYAVHLPVAGRSVVSFGRESVRPVPGGGVVFSPGDQPAMGWSPDLCQLAIRVPESAVRSHVAALTGRPLHRGLRFKHAATPSASWVPVLRMLAEVADSHAADRLPEPLAQRLLDAFLTALVLSQPHSGGDQLLATPARSGAAAVDHAAALVRAAPEQPWTLTRLATETGISGRSLESGFRRHRDCTPMEFVRASRLELAHRLLLDPQWAALPVAQIATDAGFSHLGRFAAAYRRAYGVTPSAMRRTALRR